MSEIETSSSTRRRWATVLLVAAIFSLPIGAFAVVVSTNIYFLEADATESEDVYVAATSATVFGTIDGDLVVVASDVTIAGTVTGDVIIATQGPLSITGTVDGSVRGVARDVTVSGTVAHDLAVASLTVEVTGTVGRDVLLLSASLDVTGEVGRDVLGRLQMGTLDGLVGGDVDVLVSALNLGSRLRVGGDLTYRSESDATVATGAEIAGSFSRLPSRGSFIVRSVLLFVSLIHFLSFIFAGLLLLWIFQPTLAGSVGMISKRPWRSLGVGLLAIVVVPVVIALLVFSLVGVPVGLLVLVMFALALFFAPVPAVTAFGHRILRGRGALYGGFMLGAVLWRGAIWLLPLVGLVLYALSTAMGVGGMLLTLYEQRKTAQSGMPLVPAMVGANAVDGPLVENHEGWEPPLAPSKDQNEDPPETTDGQSQ